MKTLLKTLTFLTLIFTINFSCSKDDSVDQTDEILIQSPGQVSLDEFENFKGEIGIAIDARPLARKGYKPTQVVLNVAANTGDYSQTLTLDAFSLMGQLRVPLEGLSEAAKTELTNGVEVTAEYKDENGNTIYSEPTFTSSFQSNPALRAANTSSLPETVNNQSLSLSENTSYYIQKMNDDGSPDDSAWRYLDGSGYNNVITSNVSDFSGNEPDRSFSFIPIPDETNTFAIRHKATLRYIQVSSILIDRPNFYGTNIAPNLSNRTSFSQIQNSTDYDNFKFKFEKNPDGSYIIKSVGENNKPINQISGFGLSVEPTLLNFAGTLVTTVDAEIRTWRIVSTNIQWNITNIGTTFQEPILPEAQTALSFSTTLTNCGSGNLTQIVGVEDSQTYSNTVGWEESLSMTTSNSIAVSATVDVGFQANFFGTGANYNLSLNTSYNHSWSSTQGSSNWEDKSETQNTTLSSLREVTVPSGSASLVYDVFQFYPETRVNFVQRMRIEGTDTSSGTLLTGEEIRTLFYVSKFNGVVTAIETNSIVVTIRGTVTLDKIIETESNVQDVPANCN